jgi:transposase
MIDYDSFCKLRQLHDEKGLNAYQIAAELNLDIKTVKRWIPQPTYQQRQGTQRASKLDCHRGKIAALLEQHPYTAQQIFQQLRQTGYAGGYTILKEFVRQVRPVHKPAFLMLNFGPGECAQVDWGSFGSVAVGSTRRRLSFFVMVLCFSRMMYVEFTLTEGMEQFLTCHRHALEFFNGVPAKVIIDNLKVGVLEHPLGQKAQFHPRYLDLATHYGFQPVACNVRKANEKGRVENGVGYVKKNFLNGLEIPSFAAVNPAAIQWRDTIANVRLHGETHRKPLDLFTEEKTRLKPLPIRPYDCAVIRPIGAHSCCHIILDTNRYSVPHLFASQKLTLKLYPDQVLLFYHEKLIATHSRTYDRHQKINNPDHLKELLAQRKQARDQTLLLTFIALSTHSEAYARQLEIKCLNSRHHIQKIVALSEIYGPEKVGRAIQDALSFEAYGCEYIANILEQLERPKPIPGALHLTRQQDLLDLDLPPADLAPYELKTKI